MNKKEMLEKHIFKHLDTKKNIWKKSNWNYNTKKHLLNCIKKWKALFKNVFLNDKRFLNIAEPVTDKTIFEPCNYYMRTDGSIVFIEGTLTDNYGEMIAGHPLRFPYAEDVKAKYLSNVIEPDIFGIKMKCTTKVFWNNRKDYGKQTEECFRIINNQKWSKYPILPLYFHNQKFYNENLRITQTPIFRKENFVVGFPAKKALEYMYKNLKFEPILKGTEWLLNKAHTFHFSNFDKIKYSDLGVTGSSSFGDMHDKEDFDVILYNNINTLNKYRAFLQNGAKDGIFKFVSHNRGLRVYLNESKIECNHNKPLIFCTFMNLDKTDNDILYKSKFKILDKIPYLEMKVFDDSENMITFPRVKVGDFKNVRAPRWLDLKNNMLFIQMMSTSRGSYLKGMKLKSYNVLLVEFYPVNKDKFRALVTTGWYDTRIEN